MNKSINEVKTWFKILGIEVTVRFNGKSLTINNENFRLPKSKDYEIRNRFDEKVISYVRSLFSENLGNELTENYNQLLNVLKSSNIHIDFSHINYGCTAVRDIKNNIEDAKKLIELVSTYPDFYLTIEKYSAYRNLVERGWKYITE